MIVMVFIFLLSAHNSFVTTRNKIYDFFSLFNSSYILMLWLSEGIMMDMVASDRCKEDVGACTADCNSRCVTRFQGGFGECMTINGVNDCWCYYDCTPKRCTGGTGEVGACDNTQCDLDCGHKYPGKGATGLCYSVGDPTNCWQKGLV